MDCDIVRSMPWQADADPRLLITREWLVTNGLGGYSCGTISGVITRRYHGLLVAALPTPLGRVEMLNHLSEHIELGYGEIVRFGGEERVGDVLELHGVEYLREFRLECGLPVWRYQIGDTILEKRVLMPHFQNTVHITYQLIAGSSCRIQVRPSVHFRRHDEPVSTPLSEPYDVRPSNKGYELRTPHIPPLRVVLDGREGGLINDERRIREIVYRVERSRGYEAEGDLWSPGYFEAPLNAVGDAATLIASTEDWETIHSLDHSTAWNAERDRRAELIAAAHPLAQQGPAAELVLAADQFIVTPPGRIKDTAKAHASGHEGRSVIAGYHWFTDWGRDTMISLEGLTLATGRVAEAGHILHTFSQYVRDGLLPNMFPEGERDGLYHTADATLWYFHALDRYVTISGDQRTLRVLLPQMIEIFDRHMAGTRFGIGVDPADGLLRQGAEGYQLTWMDAKVDNWVVTPRRGKAVEINALWYNALRLLETWTRQLRGESESQRFAEQADRVRRAFNERFWFEEMGFLFDVVDGPMGDDPACRPNQIFAISLPHPVLDESRWSRVLEVVQTRLLTPVGLRSLDPGHPDYKATYRGDLRTRDAAYHQGTVWAWLIGPFIDAWLKIYRDDWSRARGFLNGLMLHLDEACLGTMSEIFDAEPPFTPRGCVAQAWSIAEALRAWVKTAPPVTR